LPADAVKLTLVPIVVDWLGGEQVGAGGGWTVTVTAAVAEPLTFVHIRVKVVVVVKLPVGWEPLVATLDPLMVQVSAFVEVQVRVVDVL
jgi:hypothetical protein